MDEINKKELSEADICDLFITPAIKDAGWDPLQQIRREVTLTPGPVIVRGNMSSRSKKKKKFADYVLYKELGVPVAVVEAKDNNHTVSHGMQQALGYAEILEVPSAFSSNGDAFMKFLKATDPFAKTIIFCEDINHAERMRAAIVNAAGQLAIENPKYVMRIGNLQKERVQVWFKCLIILIFGKKLVTKLKKENSKMVVILNC